MGHGRPVLAIRLVSQGSDKRSFLPRRCLSRQLVATPRSGVPRSVQPQCGTTSRRRAGLAGEPAPDAPFPLHDFPLALAHQLGAAQLALAAIFVATLRAWPASPSDPKEASEVPASMRATLRLLVMRWSLLLFFAYTGLELAVGAWTYTLLTEGRGISMMAAGSSASLFWMALTGGRVLGVAIASRVPATVLVRGCLLLLGGGLALLATGVAPALDRMGLVAAGAAAGPIFPTLMASTPARVGGVHAGNAVGFQIAAAALEQSLVPSLLGVLGDELGLDALAIGLLGAAVVVLLVHRGMEGTSRRPG